MKRTFSAIVLFHLLASFVLCSALPAQAGIFDPGLVLTDQELFNTKTMSGEQIQEFLDGHEGVLKDYFETDIDGLLKTASMIIADAAERNQVNPQYLLVLLQKEQGLITNPTPKPSQLDWAAGYAACDSCDVDHPGLQQYKGFAKQIDRAAWRTRYFYEHPEEFTYIEGEIGIVNNQEVFMKNRATAALYNYTPHISGNRLFWKIFETWFRPLSHPDGSLLQEYGEPGIWLIQNGQKHAFKSKAALTSRYSLGNVVAVSAESLQQYPIGAPIAYPDFALVLDPSGKVYLLAGKNKRWIEDEATFHSLGFNWDEVEVAASANDLAYFDEGDVINTASAQPFAALVQDPESYGIYYVIDGVKYPLLAPELLTLNFSGLRVRKAYEGELERYPKGEPVKLKDGLLVKGITDSRVYVIANGKRLPIYSEATFNSLGYQWTNIQTVSDSLLALHDIGDMIRVEPLSDDELNAL